MGVALARSYYSSSSGGTAQDITLSSGVAGASGPGLLTLTSEAGNSDQLDQITGLSKGEKVEAIAAAGHTITVAAGANLLLPATFTLSGNKVMTLVGMGSDVCRELSRSANG